MGRFRQHVNPLKSDFLEIAVVPNVAPPSGGVLEVELGSAEAHFLFDRARERPRDLFVGVEIRREVAEQAARDAIARGLDNVRSVFANMSMDLPRMFPAGAVRRFHVNFPDPWFKGRQHKRRVVGPALIETLHRLLSDDGEISVMTDIFDIALDAMAALESEPPRRFVNVRAPWSFLSESHFSARSRRERQCADEGARVWRLLYRRC